MLFAVSIAVTAAAGVLHAVVNAAPVADQWGLPGFEGVLALVTASVGFLITRRTSNPTGWVYTALGVGSAVQYLAEQYASAVIEAGVALPAGATVAWVAEWIWVPLLVAIVLLLLVFPDDRIESRPGRIILAFGVLSAVAVFFNSAFLSPRVLTWDVVNPYAISTDPRLFDALFVVTSMMLMVAVAGAAVRLVARLRKATGVRRQQLKWFVYASVFTSIGMVLGAIPATSVVGSKFAVVGIVFIAAASAIAVLKYRLYDIDVVVNRTLVYGALTAILAAAYMFLVFGLQAVLRPITSESQVAVAASTLAVAALFRPLRARVQDFIDLRFNRQRYDARVLLDQFNHRMRDAVQLENVETLIVNLIDQTVAPRQASLWLRDRPEQSA